MNKILLPCLLALSGMASAQNLTFDDPALKSLLLNTDGLIDSSSFAYNQQDEVIVIDANGDGEIQQDEADQVYRITLQLPIITGLGGIEGFTNLNWLICNGGNFTSANLSGLANLEKIGFSYSGITSLSVNGLTHLKDVAIINTPVATIDFTGAIAIESIYLNQTEITSLSEPGLTSLKSLQLDTNPIASIDLTGFANLETLIVRNCPVTAINLSNVPTLKELSVNNTQLSDINLSAVPLLTTMDIINSNFTTIDLSQLPNLTSLYVQNTQISTLNLTALPLLNSANLSNNQLSTLDFSANPLLQNINCSNNNLTYINLKNGTSFTDEYIDFTNFSGNDNLEFICVDEDEIDIIHNTLVFNELSNVALNTYCGLFVEEQNTITGMLTFDNEGDGCDANDTAMPLSKIVVTNNTTGDTGVSFSNNSGVYTAVAGVGSFNVTPLFADNLFTAGPATATVNFEEGNTTTATQNYCITANGIHNDVEVAAVTLQGANPGFYAVYKMVVKNNGNQIASGEVTFSYNPDLMYFVSTIPTTAVNGTGISTFAFDALMPYETRDYIITLLINAPTETPAVNIGDVLTYTATATTNADETPENNIAVINDVVSGSFDPNDITCLEGNAVDVSLIGNYLRYNINFENTGNAAANFVVVNIPVNAEQFDINTLELLYNSHNAIVKVENNSIQYRFNNINLGPEEKGNAIFKIKTLSALNTGSTVNMDANIYFDYNWPIATNIAATTFGLLSTDKNEVATATVFPNPTNGQVAVKANLLIEKTELYDINGRLLDTSLPNELNAVINLAEKPAGVYLLKIYSGAAATTKKIVKL